MVAADREHAGVLDDAVGIDDVIGRAAADVNDQRAEFLLLVRQQRERRGEAVEDDFVHLQLQAFDRADGILQAVGVAVDDVHIHFQARAQHADRVGDAVLAVHEKVLADGVDDVVFGGQIDRLGVLDHVLHVVLGNFAVGGDHRMHAAVVEAADVAAGHAEINVADFHVGHLLGLDNGVAHVLLGLGASAISPLRTPRERAWPRPMMFSAPSAPSSPTTAQTFDVPISRPTMMEESSNMFLPDA